MGDDVRLTDDVLRSAHASLVEAKRDFDQVQDRAGDAADACGYDPLAQVLRESSSDWALRRSELGKSLENLAGHMQAAIDGFERWDIDTGQSMQGDSSPSPARPPSQQPAPAQPPQRSAPAQAPQQSAPAQPAQPPRLSEPAVAAPDPAPESGVPIAPASAPSGRLLAEQGFAAPPEVGGSPAPAAPVGQMGPEGEPTDPVSAVTVDAVPHGNLRLDDARLDDLLAELVQRWQSLGGQEKAIITALATAGLVGVAATGAKPGGGHRMPPHSSRLDEPGLVRDGQEPPTTGTAPGRETTPTGAVVDVEGPAAVDSTGGLASDVVGTEPLGKAEAARTPQTGAVQDSADQLPAPPPGLEALVADPAGLPAMTAEELPQAASMPSLAPEGGTWSEGPPPPVELPPLAAAPGGPATETSAAPAALPPLVDPGRPGAASATAVIPDAGLPPLAGLGGSAGTVPAAATAAIPDAGLPPLAGLGGSAGTVPAAGIPVGTSGPERTAQPVGGLPPLTAPGGSAGTAPAHERGGGRVQSDMDARAILADLSHVASKKETP